MLDKKLKKEIFTYMSKSRALEERMVKMAKSSDGFFWIGGPGEEAFNVPLGMLAHKGEGLDFDYFHFHYRNSATMIAMGEQIIDPIRQMASTITDPYSGGRLFAGHFAKKSLNVMPVCSVIAVQYSVAIGSALAQARHGGKGISIVTGGDAGTAEGDFATCLGWSNMPNKALPLLIIVTNNRWGISTPYQQVHGEEIIARRAESYGIPWDTVDGNDVEASYIKLQEVMKYIRETRKPFCLEAYVSRLHGHSSSSGGNRVTHERDCLEEFQNKLVQEGVYTADEIAAIRQGHKQEAKDALAIVRKEPKPSAENIYDHVFAV